MLNTFKNLNWKDIVVRSSKTFSASFLAGWALTGYAIEKGAIVGAVSAGFTALLNFGLEVWNSQK